MELKNRAWELCEAYTSFNSWIDQAEERISEMEDQINEIKWKGKLREKRVKKMNKASKNYGIMWKKSYLHLITVPEHDGENESKLENTL